MSGRPGGGNVSDPTPLARRLGQRDAIAIGLGSMIGAGVFAAFTPAAAAAGSGLLVGLAIAAVVAWGNATSSAQLAAQYPTSGGTYVYGRERLGAWPGYLAAKNAKFKKIYDNWKKFRDDQLQWFAVAENRFDNFMQATRVAGRSKK